MRKLAATLCVALLAPSLSHAKSLDELLVDKGVISKAEAANVATTSGSPAKVYWDDGTKIEFPDAGFTTQVNTLIQTRYTFTDNDNKANTSSFDVTKARIYIQGTALHKEFAYKLNGDFVGTSSDGTKNPDLRDAWIQWKPCDFSAIRVGQFKTSTSRQFTTEDHLLAFADRSKVSDFFDLGRQDGATDTTTFWDGMATVNVGIFNGQSDGEGINKSGVDTKHTGVLNVRLNPMGKMNAMDETDYEWTEKPALSMGATYAYSDLSHTFPGATAADAGTTANVHKHSVSADAIFKYQGWTAAGEFFYQNYDIQTAGATDVKPLGFYAQVGYFVDPKKVELAARYGLIDCDSGRASGICSGNDKVNEVDVGLNYFFWKNNLKAQLNYAFLNQKPMGGGDDVNTSRWLIQLSSYL